MSGKRQATTQLNHENWDQEDPSEHEEVGTFKTASKDVLEKRVIRTAKRRAVVPGDEPKSVFSGFGGFNKAPPSSFDFLSNLTNGNKPNGSSVGKTDTPVVPSIFGGKTSNSASMFNMPVASTTKSTFGLPSTQSSPSFGVTSASTGPSTFTASAKTGSTVADTSFKVQDTTDASKTPGAGTNAISQSTIFGVPSTNTSNSLFASTNNNSAPFKIQPVTSSPSVQVTFGTGDKMVSNKSEDKVEDRSNDKKLKYYSKLKGLNESVLDWIKKHVEETPLCILSPIFKDYENHLKEIQDEYHGDKQTKKPNENISTDKKPSSILANVTKCGTGFSANNSVSSPFSGTTTVSPSSKTPLLGNLSNAVSSADKNPVFSFGINTTSTNTSRSTDATAGVGFPFRIQKNTPEKTISATASSPFSLTQTITDTSSVFSMTTTTTSANSTAPFSFGIGKPFSFSPNVQKPADQTTNESNEEEDQPPKVEFTPVVEDNCVFEKRCKIFIKKDGNFADVGVGTLYIKKIEESGKHQLLARANTNLGNILLNLILTSSIPTQRLGKNNVMLVCIPTPDAKPPPTPILIRVKTSEEADDLLEILNKYKE